MSTEGGTKAVVAALTANIFIALTKFGAWALTGASSMLAEAIHSVADSGNQVLLLVGGKRATREATPEHPFGYGRERYVFAFIVAVVLFSVGGLFALYEAYHKYEEVHSGAPNELLEGRWWWVPLVVLGAAIIAESFSFRTAIVESNKVRGKQSWSRFIRSAKAPELPVILLEDLAALLGLIFALFGVGHDADHPERLLRRHRHRAIGLLLVLVAITLAIEMKSLLLGEAASVDVGAQDRGGAHRLGGGGAGDPHEDPAPGAGGGAGGGQDRGRTGRDGVGGGRHHRPGRAQHPRPPSRWSPRSTWSRTSTTPTTCPPPAQSVPPPRATDFWSVGSRIAL